LSIKHYVPVLFHSYPRTCGFLGQAPRSLTMAGRRSEGTVTLLFGVNYFFREF
jgi:hypothetical protein